MDLIHEVYEEAHVIKITVKQIVTRQCNTWEKEPKAWKNGERKIPPIGIAQKTIIELRPSSRILNNHSNKQLSKTSLE